MIALIDADIITYRSAFAAEHVHYKIFKTYESEDFYANLDEVSTAASKADLDTWFTCNNADPEDYLVERVKVFDGPEVAKMAAKATMESILDKLQVSDYKAYLTGEGNYRFKRATIKPYKGHRPERPKYHAVVRDYLINYWKAEVIDGMEADDRLGIEQYYMFSRAKCPSFGIEKTKQDLQLECNTVICSIDKDLKMIPGWHYNFVTDEKVFIDEVEAYRNFYRQCITGDTTDNIPGLYHITGNKATRQVLDKLEDCKTIAELSNYVAELYKGHEEQLDEISDLLWICRQPEDVLV